MLLIAPAGGAEVEERCGDLAERHAAGALDLRLGGFIGQRLPRVDVVLEPLAISRGFCPHFDRITEKMPLFIGDFRMGRTEANLIAPDAESAAVPRQHEIAGADGVEPIGGL